MPAPASLLDRPHEWLSFEDPTEDRTWLIDVTFLLSPWNCIFGAGCQGVLTGPAPELAQGCCSYGAHFTDKADVARVKRAAATLTAEEWQFHPSNRRKGDRKGGIWETNDDGDMVTRQADGACVFLNRPGWATGAGCALHQAALTRGLAPLALKPNVCWQLPLRRDDEVGVTGHVTSTVRQWDRRDWGDGGYEFHWWCTEDPAAFTGARPVYESMRDELVELIGQPVYDLLARYLATRRDTLAAPLPHPAVPVKPPRRKLKSLAR